LILKNNCVIGISIKFVIYFSSFSSFYNTSKTFRKGDWK
jgi:hypothetical protein